MAKVKAELWWYEGCCTGNNKIILAVRTFLFSYILCTFANKILPVAASLVSQNQMGTATVYWWLQNLQKQFDHKHSPSLNTESYDLNQCLRTERATYSTFIYGHGHEVDDKKTYTTGGFVNHVHDIGSCYL